MAIDPIEKAMLLAQGMEKGRAIDVMVLDMRPLMTITDHFVICHGRSQTHVDAIRETVEQHMEENDIRPGHREGGRGARWVILDYGSAVGHVFTEEAREYYDLERLWEDAPVMDHVADDGPDEDAPVMDHVADDGPDEDAPVMDHVADDGPDEDAQAQEE